MLYLVGTPIGNMGDISERAVEVLSSADLIACEDTRRTGLLLSNLGIKGNLTSYHEHNKASKGNVLIQKLKEGLNVVQVSDAGMPCISDPGSDLVKLCIEEDIPVTCVPGPVAAITALVLSGLDTRYYHFEGFIPVDNKERKARIEALKKYNETVVIYEAPHRLLKTIDDLIEAGFSDCEAAFCRELTKKYEQVVRLKISEAKAYFTEVPPKGEFVICLKPVFEQKEEKELSEDEIESMARNLISEGCSTKQTAARLAELTGRNKKDMYSYVLNLIK